MTDFSRPSIGMSATVIDCPDPRGLAQFYSDLLGWPVDPDDCSDEWVTIRSTSERAGVGRAGRAEKLCFQLAIAYVPPTWPDASVPQQLHLDLVTDDLDSAQAWAESIGAVHRPSTGERQSFRVFLDPSGHPFCLRQSGGQPG